MDYTLVPGKAVTAENIGTAGKAYTKLDMFIILYIPVITSLGDYLTMSNYRTD